MSLMIYGQAPPDRRDVPALNWNLRATVTHGARIAAQSVKEASAIICTMVGLLAILAASMALDVWIWVPRLGH